MGNDQEIFEHMAIKAGYPKEEVDEANKLLNNLAKLCDNKQVGITMNVVTNLLVILFMENFPKSSLELLISKVTKTYTVRREILKEREDEPLN